MAEYPGIQQKISQAAQTIRAIADTIGEIETEIYRGTPIRNTPMYGNPTYPIGAMGFGTTAGIGMNPTDTGINETYATNAAASYPGAWPIPPQGNFGYGNMGGFQGGPIFPQGIPTMAYTPFGIQTPIACQCPGIGFGTPAFGINPSTGFGINPSIGFGINPSIGFGINPATPINFPTANIGSPYPWTFAGSPWSCPIPGTWGIPSGYTPFIGYAGYGYPMNWTWSWDRAGQGAWGTPSWNQSAWSPNGWNAAACQGTGAGTTPQG